MKDPLSWEIIKSMWSFPQDWEYCNDHSYEQIQHKGTKIRVDVEGCSVIRFPGADECMWSPLHLRPILFYMSRRIAKKRKSEFVQKKQRESSYGVVLEDLKGYNNREDRFIKKL